MLANSNSMNEAAKKIYISQPSLSAAVRELEDEIGISLFIRTNRGIRVTPEGEEFITFAHQITEQYELLQDRFINNEKSKKKFNVSTQHYSFAVAAFVSTVKQFGVDNYEFAIRETRTWEVIEDVKNLRSEIGVLYLNDFNEASLRRIFEANELEFHPLMECNIYAYMSKSHPLAKRKKLSIEELEEYPCLSFEQGSNNSFFFAEEMLGTYPYKKLIKANDRATMLNLMIGLNGYTLCSGIICEELNGDDYCAVRIKENQTMTIGYIAQKSRNISPIAETYIRELSSFKSKTMK